MIPVSVSEIVSLNHGDAMNNSIVMIDETHAILMFEDDLGDGYIRTLSISDSSIATIDTLKIDDLSMGSCCLIKIDDTHFIGAHRGGNAETDGIIQTFSIDSNYENIAIIDSWTYTGYGINPSLVMIDSTHFIIACGGYSSDGYIYTFAIDGSYGLSTHIDALRHDFNGTYNSLVMLDATHFILAYLDDSGDGRIKAFSIDTNYDNILQLYSLAFDAANGTYNSLIKIDDTHVILAYTSNAGVGKIETFLVNGDYSIASIDSYQHDTAGSYNSLVKISDTYYLLAYAGPDSDGFVKLFEIDGDYDISAISSLEHDTANGTYNSLVQIDEANYALAYTSAGDAGYVKYLTLDDGTPDERFEEGKGDEMRTMVAIDLVDEISANFIDRPPRKLTEMYINSIIHIINSRMGKKDEIITITGSGNDWSDIGSDWSTLDTNWEEIGRFTNGFTYDSDEYKLTIPPSIDKVVKLWVDDEIWSSRSYEAVKDGELTDKIYCHVGNDLYFSEDIAAETTVVKVQVEMNYPDIADGYVTLGYDFRQTLVSGAIKLLAGTQKYRDPDLYSIHSSIYDKQIEIMRVQTNTADSPEILNFGAADSLKNTRITDDYYQDY